MYSSMITCHDESFPFIWRTMGWKYRNNLEQTFCFFYFELASSAPSILPLLTVRHSDRFQNIPSSIDSITSKSTKIPIAIASAALPLACITLPSKQQKQHQQQKQDCPTILFTNTMLRQTHRTMHHSPSPIITHEIEAELEIKKRSKNCHGIHI